MPSVQNKHRVHAPAGRPRWLKLTIDVADIESGEVDELENVLKKYENELVNRMAVSNGPSRVEVKRI